MFGMINPTSNYNQPSSANQMMAAAAANSSDIAAIVAHTNTMTANNDKAANWGSNIDLAALPDWSQKLVLENIA